jgi:aryl-alcohol dehydrogenase-like predicted oxidoreductase
MGMSAFYKDKDHDDTSEQDCIKVIHWAAELGVTMLDTSDIYGPHTNEVLVGKALQGRRNDYQLATKFGITTSWQNDASRAYVRSACEGSLERLNIDCIDLYYLHRMDPKTPIEETMSELKALVEEGKIKYVGLSEVSVEDLRRAHKVHPVTAVQLEWSLFTRGAEHDLIPACRELGIAIVAYSPVGRGVLAGKYSSVNDFGEDDWRRQQPRFQEEAFNKNLKMVEQLKAIAAKKNITPAQLALAWLHHQGEDVFPIPGTKRVKYLEENAAAFHVQLSKQELADIEAAVPHDQVIGDRYDEAMMKSVYSQYGKTVEKQLQDTK